MNHLRRLVTSVMLGLGMLFGAGAIHPVAAETAATVSVAQDAADDVYLIEVYDVYIIYDDGRVEYAGQLIVITRIA